MEEKKLIVLERNNPKKDLWSRKRRENLGIENKKKQKIKGIVLKTKYNQGFRRFSKLVIGR